MTGCLDGKSVIVTGAGRGIGRAVALRCAEEGAGVVVNDYGVSMDGNEPSSEPANEVVDLIRHRGGRAVAAADDVTRFETGERLLKAALSEFGRLDGVVCVAGILRERMLFNMEFDEWQPVIDTHLTGTFNVFRWAARHFREQQSGSLVGFTSGAFAASLAQPNYSAAKGGIVSLTRSAAAAMYKYGVRANVVAPVAKTRMSANVPGGVEAGDAEDVAPMVAYLLSDASQDITGQVYTVNGGKIAVWNQPVEVREMVKEGQWSPDEIHERLRDEVGQEEMGIIRYLAQREQAAKQAQQDA